MRPHDAESIEPIFVSAQTAAKMLNISPKTLWTLTKRGAIRSANVGSRVLYRVDDLKTYAAEAVRARDNAHRS